jgi:hypothetical protein
MADYYDQLSQADQGTFRATLFAVVGQAACPSVDMSGITNPNSLNDPANRAAAVDCAQTALQVGVSPGVLDQATYNAIMRPGSNTAWSTGKKVAVGAAAVGGAVLLWWLLSSKPRPRRR